MIKKLTLLAGVGVGYILGAKAGQERYQQIRSKFDDVMGKPEVKQAAETLQSAAGDLADRAKTTVQEKVGGIDLTDSSSTATTSPITGAKTQTPMAGAAASGSAPDITRR